MLISRGPVGTFMIRPGSPMEPMAGVARSPNGVPFELVPYGGPRAAPATTATAVRNSRVPWRFR